MHSEAALCAMSRACQPQSSLLAKQKEVLQARLDYTGQVNYPNPRPEYKMTLGRPCGVVHPVLLALQQREGLQANTRSCPCKHCRDPALLATSPPAGDPCHQ